MLKYNIGFDKYKIFCLLKDSSIRECCDLSTDK